MWKENISDLFVTPHSSIGEVIQCIDRSRRISIALIIDENQRLIDTITDGDIRRGIIAGMTMETPVTELLKIKANTPHPVPTTAVLGTPPDQLLRVMRKRSVQQIPLLNEDGQIVDIVILSDLLGFIPLCIPEIRGNEWAYLKECLDSNYVSSIGLFVTRFEQMVADYVGHPYAVATTSGTAALHIALLVAGVQPGEEVLVSTLTFIASANAIRYVGAYPVFIDADPEYWQMDPEKLSEFVTDECVWENNQLKNRRTGRKVSAILPVHILGHPCNMDPILEVARQHNLVVIEDAAESLGAKYKDAMVGTLGDIACFSFNGNKIITTGGGGMIVTSNEKWANKARYLTTQAKDDQLEFIHGEVGYNYRLTNIQAALGCAQLEQLNSYIDIKRAIASNYTEAFEGIPGLIPPRQAPWASSIYWMYTILVDDTKYGMDSRSLLRALESEGIQTRPLWQPMHRSPVFSDLPTRNCPVADKLNRMALSLPCSVGVMDEQVKSVVQAIQRLQSE